MPTQYEKEMLSSLYKSLDYLNCEDLPIDGVLAAIRKIESDIRDRKENS